MKAKNNLIKIAIVSTPRAGNTWVRYSLAEALQVPSISVHRYTDLDDVELPEQFILQIHAQYSDAGFHRFIDENNMSVLTIHRHPLDVLISMLRFIQVQAGALQWLDGEARVESLYGLSPASHEFIDWCLSNGATKLLNISYDWAKSGEAAVIGYESLLTDPATQLGTILKNMNIPMPTPQLSSALKKFNPGYFKNQRNHSWNASKDNWVNFFTKTDAQKIYSKYRNIFDFFNYDVAAAMEAHGEAGLSAWKHPIFKPDRLKFLNIAIRETEINNQKLYVENLMSKKEIKRQEGRTKALAAKLEDKNEELMSQQQEIRALRNELESIKPLRRHVKLHLKRRFREIDAKVVSRLAHPDNYHPVLLDHVIKTRNLETLLEKARQNDSANFARYALPSRRRLLLPAYLGSRGLVIKSIRRIYHGRGARR